jgi:dTDP-4-dehydrorhamnose 3,5-epimerase
MRNILAATKAKPSVDSNWDLSHDLIAGAEVREMKNVITPRSRVTEFFRQDWDLSDAPIRHVVQIALNPGAITAWHMHHHKRDHIVVPAGLVKLVLYDGREKSSTQGKLNVFHMSPMRPMVVGVPAGVWHGFQNLSSAEVSYFVNISTQEYSYENPDEWYLPVDTAEIPYSF